MDEIIVLSCHPYNDGRIKKHINTVKEWVDRLAYIRFPFQDNVISNEYAENVAYYQVDIPQKNAISKNLILVSPKTMERVIFFLKKRGFLGLGKRGILHSHDPHSLAFAKLLKRKFPLLKIVYDRHEYWDASYRMKHNMYIEKFCAKRINGLICVTDYMKNNLPEYLRAVNHIANVPNWPDSSMFSVPKIEEKICQSIHGSNANVRVLYAGYLDRSRTHKMLNFMSLVLSYCPGIKFEICGRGPSSGDVVDFASQYPGKCEFLGNLRYDLALQKMQDAHIGLIMKDLIPLIVSSTCKLYEYMFCGAVPFGTLTEDNEDKLGLKSLFSKEMTTHHLYEILSTLINNDNAISTEMRKAREIGKNYIWEKAVEGYKECYENITTE